MKAITKTILCLLGIWAFGLQAEAQDVDDIVLKNGLNYLNTPYVANVLDNTDGPEELILNCDELDCQTFVEYVTGKRMEKAKKLLKNTTKSAGEIAQEVGYKDSHYFSFVFKKTQGCSPREYRSGKKGQADRQADGQ